MVYGCFMDWEAKTEKICSLGDSADGGRSMGNMEFPESKGREVLEGSHTEKQLDHKAKIQDDEDDELEVLQAAPLYIAL